MKYAFTLILFLITQQVTSHEGDDFSNWVSANRALVESGKMKASEFYARMYDQVLNLKSVYDKSNMLLAINMRIKAAHEYESGLLTKEDYKSKLREANAIWLKPGSERPSDSLPAIQTPLQSPNQISCQSTKFGNTTNTNCQSY